MIDELTTHTDTGRQELIHPYKTLYGRDLNSVLKDNLGDSWEEACATLMAEMRMYELECLRRRMEDEAAAKAAREAHEIAENNSMLSSIKSPTSMRSARSSGSKGSGSKSSKKKNGTAKMKIEDMLDECATEEETFSGHSCLLITWKTNPEVEKFKEDFIFGDIMKTEMEEKSMLLWLGQVIYFHFGKQRIPQEFSQFRDLVVKEGDGFKFPKKVANLCWASQI